MKLLTLRTILFFSYSSSSTALFSHGCTIHRVHHYSTSLPHNSILSSSSRRQDEESRNVRVSVWWDFENCSIPGGVNVFKVAHSITAAIRANGIKGPIQVTAFGDIFQLSRLNQEALSSTGINLAHIPHGGKNSADRSLLVDLMCWVTQHPPPAHLFLISGDRDFAGILHRLRMNNYNILLASPETAPNVLCSAASIMWQWNTLVRGENLAGKHFNQPPDGPYNSWYGHYKVPLEDPYSIAEQPACLRATELSEPASESKLRPIPRSVIKQIRQILSSYPKGMSITELRSELAKSNVNLDKDLYGYKKFSRFLLSMPHILKVQFGSDGQYFVRGPISKTPEPVVAPSNITAQPVSNNGDPDVYVASNLNGGLSSISKSADGNFLSTVQPSELNVKGTPAKVQNPPLDKKVADEKNSTVADDHPPPAEEHDPTSETGFFLKFSRKWFVGKANSSAKTCSIPEECHASGASSENTKSNKRCEKSLSSCSKPVPPASNTSSNDGSILDNRDIKSSEVCGDKSGASAGFFCWIIKLCKFWSSGLASEISSDDTGTKLSHTNNHSGKHELFSVETFWRDMESYLGTHKGSGIVSQSRTREQMAQELQKEGPLVLKSLSGSDLLHLVELLVSEKKWVEECPSQNLPFKLTRPVRKSSCLGHDGSNGLRSIFLNKRPPSDFQRVTEEGQKKYQNLHHSGVSPSIVNKKPSDRSRNEILADCEMLVAELLKEHPGGFNLAAFRKQFLQKYGYSLDYEMLGYQKLASLLQIMPGVRIESSYVVPSIKASKDSSLEISVHSTLENNATGSVTSSDSESSDTSRRDNDLDSPWEELGPVASSSSNGDKMESGLSRKAKVETLDQNKFDYESVSGDELSDSEGETVSERQGKPGINDEESSLLQILDSWYSSKEDKSARDYSENVDGMVDCSKDGSKLYGLSRTRLNSETLVNRGRRQKTAKSYSFVSDPVEDNKDGLIDGILGSLKKSGESRLQG
ncbi:uncharacterized protein LOC131166787 [Malania oleifera]|uniref:uncharacterized protein LOC131166787 n=1 Tax=Malania oleifera TaxID=397392 RepID=UPI0025AE25FE|nr:uncharacterized protein LOC131166787 [Malania oleifera]